jgi:Fe-S cluster biogenesis protein NfuA
VTSDLNLGDLNLGDLNLGDRSIDERTIGDTIERKLGELQARLDPRAFDQTVELLQLVSELYGEGLTRVMELADRHAPDLVGYIVADGLLASLLVANGLHPDDVSVRIARALDGVRPFLAGHGGDVELLDIDEHAGAVRIRLLGSCDGCPSSAVTLRTTVERAIIEAAPEIEIIDVEEPSDHAVATPISLGSKPPTSRSQVAFDPATGCGAAFESGVSVS